MYGLQGKLIAKPSRNRAYAIAVFEVWDDKAAHDASVQIESVRSVIAKGRPLIAGRGESVELRPVGGQGLD